MDRTRTLEAQLQELNELASRLDAPDSLPRLKKGLASKRGPVVAKAAKLAGARGRDDLTPDLVAAFDRMLVDGVKSDAGCRAKGAIAAALRKTGGGGRVFLKGIRYRQMEPVWGGQEDTATELRTIAALGLVETGHPDLMPELVRLLADPEAVARVGAVQAVAASGRYDGMLLVLLRASIGDPSEQVMASCFDALLVMAPDTCFGIVAEFLDDSRPAVCEAAALALGDSRSPGAFEALAGWWRRIFDRDLKRTALLAMATLRDERAFSFLLEVLGGGSGADAGDALTALELHRHDAGIGARARQVASTVDDDARRKAIEDVFGAGPA